MSLHFEVPDMYVKVYENHFTGRQKTLFDALETAEKVCGKDVEVAQLAKSKRKIKSKICRSEVKPFRGKESIFKVPNEPAPRMRFRNMVTAVQNAANRSPKRGRWTKYSLENVDDISDRSNASAAFSFLQELRDRRSAHENDSETVSLDQFKPQFNKRESRDRNTMMNFQSTKKGLDSSEGLKSCSKTEASTGVIQPRIKLNHLDCEEGE